MHPVIQAPKGLEFYVSSRWLEGPEGPGNLVNQAVKLENSINNYAMRTVAGSIFTPAPIVEEIATRLT